MKRLVVLIACLTGMGCKPKKFEDALGPAIPIADVQKAISDPLAGFTVLDLQKGDVVLTNDRLYVASSPMIATRDNLTEIFERREDDSKVYVSMKETIHAYKEGQRTYSARKHYEFAFLKNPPRREESPAPASSELSLHNLQVSHALIPAPEGVQEQPGCLGIPQCQLEATLVSVDKVLYGPQGAEKVHMEWVLSRQVPYLASVLSQCSSMVTIFEDTPGEQIPLYIKACTDVTDFRYGLQPKAFFTRFWTLFQPLGWRVSGANQEEWTLLDPFHRSQDHLKALNKAP